ncbi:MAG: hypothetical protein KF770_19005 [Anaerolineae bacterium]|nr:hypothetical protein [Anaerolineae bacterium]
MTTLILPQVNGKDSYTEINIQASVISAETACRKASFYLAMNVGHLLRATNPRLLLDDDLLKWQLDVILTSPQGGTPQQIGHMFLAASDGSVLFADELMHTLTALDNAPSAG